MTLHTQFLQARESRTFCNCVFVLWLCLPTGAVAQDQNKAFVSSYGFTLRYPSNWEFRGLPSHFQIDNFPASQWRKGAGLPHGGASVFVILPRELAVSKGVPAPKTLDEWVGLGTGRKTVESRRAFEITENGRQLAITEVRTLCCAVPPYQEAITWYFSVGTQLFSATFQRWQGEGSERDLSLLREIVLSIHVSQPTSGK